MGQMRVKAAFAAIHAIEGHHPFLNASGEDAAERLECVCQVSGRRETFIEPLDMSTVRHSRTHWMFTTSTSQGVSTMP
jgi:hypothetical protein